MRKLLIVIILTYSVYLCGQESIESKRFFDTKVSNIVLNIPDSTLFRDVEKRDCDPNCIQKFYNEDKTEVLIAYFYPGRVKYAPSYFVVSSRKEHEIIDDAPILQCESFITERGISLHQSIDSVLSKFMGTKINILITDNKKFSFNYIDREQAGKEHSLYVAKYLFEDNELVSFEFGFEYP